MSEADPNIFAFDDLNPSDLFSRGLEPVQPARISPMILRISARGEIRYINASFAAYLGSTVEELVDQPVQLAKQLCSPQIAECMDAQTASMAASGLVSDASGRVFEPLVSLDAGVLDVILAEVTLGATTPDSFQSITGVAFSDMDEREYRTFRSAATGDVSILAFRIHSLETFVRSQASHDLRIFLDAIEEAATHAITDSSGTIASAGVGCFLGIFGAPRQFEDHALRAVIAASELRKKLIRMAATFVEDGKSFPKLGLAIWTGEALTGALGGQRFGSYSAIGAPVQAALELSNLGGEAEILLGEPTLAELIAMPPEDWTFQSVQSESDPDLSDFRWAGSTILPLPEALVRLRCEMVPADLSGGPAYFTFEYLWNLQPADANEPVPVVRLLDDEQAATTLRLREASNQVQGHALGRYKLLEVLGVGGMGKVWLAKDRFGYLVAIKVLNTHGTPDAAALKRFRREGEAMAKLRHRSICRIHEMNEVDGVSFIAMEYVSGISLSALLTSLPQSTVKTRRAKSGSSELTDLIRTAKSELSTQAGRAQPADSAPKVRSLTPLPVEQSLTLFLKICEAVQFAHEQGVLHRDLKPANILLREDGEPLVADFGLAKFAGSEDEASLSLTGNVVGTLQNMAPEQADSSKHVDERADVYSLGTILYLMLTGHPHFTPTGNIVVDGPKLQEHRPVRPRVHNLAIDADLETIVLKCLRPEPSRRYRSARALWSDLDHYRRGEPIAARPVSPAELLWKQVLRHKTVSALSAAFLLILGFGTVAAFWQIAERAQAAQAAATDAIGQRKEAEIQRQLALLSKKDAEEKQALAEQREREAKVSAEAAQAREKEAQEALAGLRRAEAETQKQSQLRLSAEEEAKKSEQLRLAAESQAESGIREPTMTLREQHLGKGISLTEGAEHYRKEIEKTLSSFGSEPIPSTVIFTFGAHQQPSPKFPASGSPAPMVMQDTWACSGQLSSDFVSKLSHLDHLLALYTLYTPEQGLPLLLYFKLSIFDVDGAISIIESMKQLGITPEFQVNPKATVADIRKELLIALSHKDSIANGFLRIRDQMLMSVQVQAKARIQKPWSLSNNNIPLPARVFTQLLSSQLVSSDLSTAASLANWNADTIVDFRASVSDSFTHYITATGRGVVTLAPLFARYRTLQSLDISYTSVSMFPALPLGEFLPMKLVARHSNLNQFKQLNEPCTSIRELDLNYSQFTSLEQILEFSSLRKLSIAGVPAKDASILFMAGKLVSLEELDVSQVPISSFKRVSSLRNLRSLRFSPKLVSDQISISELRSMNLKSISTPNDPTSQSAQTFWARWDQQETAEAQVNSPNPQVEYSLAGTLLQAIQSRKNPLDPNNVEAYLKQPPLHSETRPPLDLTKVQACLDGLDLSDKSHVMSRYSAIAHLAGKKLKELDLQIQPDTPSIPGSVRLALRNGRPLLLWRPPSTQEASHTSLIIGVTDNFGNKEFILSEVWGEETRVTRIRAEELLSQKPTIFSL